MSDRVVPATSTCTPRASPWAGRCTPSTPRRRRTSPPTSPTATACRSRSPRPRRRSGARRAPSTPVEPPPRLRRRLIDAVAAEAADAGVPRPSTRSSRPGRPGRRHRRRPAGGDERPDAPTDRPTSRDRRRGAARRASAPGLALARGGRGGGRPSPSSVGSPSPTSQLRSRARRRSAAAARRERPRRRRAARRRHPRRGPREPRRPPGRHGRPRRRRRHRARACSPPRSTPTASDQIYVLWGLADGTPPAAGHLRRTRQAPGRQFRTLERRGAPLAGVRGVPRAGPHRARLADRDRREWTGGTLTEPAEPSTATAKHPRRPGDRHRPGTAPSASRLRHFRARVRRNPRTNLAWRIAIGVLGTLVLVARHHRHPVPGSRLADRLRRPRHPGHRVHLGRPCPAVRPATTTTAGWPGSAARASWSSCSLGLATFAIVLATLWLLGAPPSSPAGSASTAGPGCRAPSVGGLGSRRAAAGD